MPAPTSSSKSALAERLNDHSVSTWSGRCRCVGTICFLGICMVVVPRMDCVIGHAHFLVLLPFFAVTHPSSYGQRARHDYCPCAAPLTRLAMVWASMASASPLRATYKAL